VSAGVAYDSTPVDDDDRTISFAVDETWRVAAGAHYDMSAATALRFGYVLAWGGDVPLDQSRGPLAGRLSGTFAAAALHFFVISVRWAH
jgi:long-chain fatty acid transport protein